MKRVGSETSPEPFIPSLIGLGEWAAFGERDCPELAQAAGQAMLRINLRREHGCGLRGQVLSFDRHDALHPAQEGGAE